MFFKRFELKVITGVMAPMNGARDTVTDICRDENFSQFRFGVRFDEYHHTPYLTLNVAQVLVPTRSEQMYTTPYDLVFVCDSPPSNSE